MSDYENEIRDSIWESMADDIRKIRVLMEYRFMATCGHPDFVHEHADKLRAMYEAGTALPKKGETDAA